MTTFTVLDEASVTSLADLVADRVLAQMALYGHRSNSKWLTTREAATYLGRSVSATNELARSGGLPSHCRGKRRWFDRDEVDTWVRNG